MPSSRFLVFLSLRREGPIPACLLAGPWRACVGMCVGAVPRSRRACVRPTPVDGSRSPNLTVDVARELSGLIWWFRSQSGEDAVHLRGVTECTLLVFRLCATGLGLPGATPPPVSRGACRHGQFHYQRLELSSSEVLAAVLRGVSVAPLSLLHVAGLAAQVAVKTAMEKEQVRERERYTRKTRCCAPFTRKKVPTAPLTLTQTTSV